MNDMDNNDELMKFGVVSEEFEDVELEETGQGESIVRYWKTVRRAGEKAKEDWLNDAPPQRRYLLSVKAKLDAWKVTEPVGVLPMGRVGMLAAAGGAGKSQALAQLGVSVACGRTFFETYAVDTPGHVLLVMGEEEEVEMRRRIYYVCKGLDLSDKEKDLVRDRITFLALSGVPVCLTQQEKKKTDEPTAFNESNDTPFAGVLKEHIESAGHPWSLLVFDPLSRFAGPDVEIDNSAATSFVQALERFTHVEGTPTVLVAHHTNKASRQGLTDAGAARGSTALTDGVRWQANLDAMPSVEVEERKLPGYLTFKVTKSNYAAFPEPLTLVREPDAHGVLRAATAAEQKEYSEAVEEKLVEHKAKKTELNAKARELAKDAKNQDREVVESTNSDSNDDNQKAHRDDAATLNVVFEGAALTKRMMTYE